MRAVELRASAHDDVERNARAIFRSGERAHDFGVGVIYRRSFEQRCTHRFQGLGVDAVPDGRFEIARDIEQNIAAPGRHTTVYRRNRWHGNFSQFREWRRRSALTTLAALAGLLPEDTNARRAADDVEHIQASIGRNEILDGG